MNILYIVKYEQYVCVCTVGGGGGCMNGNKTVVFESQAALETDCSLCSSPQAVGRVSLSLSRGGGVCQHRIPHSSVNPFQSEACVGSSTLTPASLISQSDVPPIVSSPPLLCKTLLSQSSSSGFRITTVHQYEGGDALSSFSSTENNPF